MTETVFIIGAVACVLSLLQSVVLVYGLKKMGDLGSVEPRGGPTSIPRVSIVVPACNEEETVEKGVRSLLDQDYPNLEIIVIDDRSTDGTYDRLMALKRQYASLRIERITTLPDGWLGKSHALFFGAGLADGDTLLFTDADIQMERSTVSRAVATMEKNGTDHLSLFFKNISSGWLLNSLILDGCAGLLIMFRPWKVADPRSRTYVGVGAFNMVRKDVYQQIGGHASIRMHPIDDIMLGKIIKRNGWSQQCLLALNFVSVHWYESVSQMISGLMKNLFSLFHYRVTVVFCAAVVVLIAHIAPLWGALFASGSARILFFLALCTRMASLSSVRHMFGVSRWCLPGFLLTPYFSIFMVMKSAWLTIRKKGIEWRGTFYPLAELKKSEPLLF